MNDWNEEELEKRSEVVALEDDNEYDDVIETAPAEAENKPEIPPQETPATAEPDGEEKTSVLSEVMGWTEALLTALMAVLLINLFFLRSITVSGNSMNDTLQDKDKVFALNFMYTPARGDIVIIQADKVRLQGTNLYGETIIKRVVAIEGDTVRIDFTDGKVFLKKSGSQEFEELKEDYIRERIRDRYDGWLESNVDYTVPENCVFVMGDNRNVSNDSRNLADIGFIDRDLIMGKAIIRYAPFSKIKWL